MLLREMMLPIGSIQVEIGIISCIFNASNDPTDAAYCDVLQCFLNGCKTIVLFNSNIFNVKERA